MRRFSSLIGAFVVLSAAASCRGEAPRGATERLWVSELPNHPRAPFAAFLTMQNKDGRFFGTFYRGSAVRGSHDAFRWEPIDDDHAKVRFLQDGSTRNVRLESCRPARGFDLCIVMHGDPTGVKRYQSRKRWIVRGPRKRNVDSMASVWAELSDEHEDLAALAQTPDGE